MYTHIFIIIFVIVVVFVVLSLQSMERQKLREREKKARISLTKVWSRQKRTEIILHNKWLVCSHTFDFLCVLVLWLLCVRSEIRCERCCAKNPFCLAFNNEQTKANQYTTRQRHQTKNKPKQLPFISLLVESIVLWTYNMESCRVRVFRCKRFV